MFTGRSTTYDPKTKEHTMIVNMDKQAGAFTCVVWDGLQSRYAREGNKALVGTFTRGEKRIEVLVYGGALPQKTIISLLTAWIGGKWVKMTLKELEGGAVIPKHQI